MRAAFIERYGSNEVVQLSERPEPTIGPHDLLVQVRAASVNPIDLATRSGRVKPLLNYQLPLILGSDLSGVVLQVGAAVRRFKPRDEVYARLEKHRIGAFAERVALAEDVAALKPSNLTHTEAASIPLVGLTAYQALIEIGQLRDGQRILVQAGSGGVGTFAIQLARHVGASVATTVSQRNATLVRQLGADVTIDYRTERFEERLHGYDVVLDTQSGKTLERGFRVLRPGGVIITVAGLPSFRVAQEHHINPLLAMALYWLEQRWHSLARRHRVRYAYLFMRPDGAQLERITDLLETRAIRPVIDRVFPFEQIREALAYSESGRATGKIIIEVTA